MVSSLNCHLKLHSDREHLRERRPEGPTQGGALACDRLPPKSSPLLEQRCELFAEGRGQRLGQRHRSARAPPGRFGGGREEAGTLWLPAPCRWPEGMDGEASDRALTSPPVDLRPLSKSPRDPSRRAALREVERALLTDGWLRVRLSDLEKMPAEVASAYEAASGFFSWPAAERCRFTRECMSECGCLGLTYLPPGEEPLYDSGATQQHVHSLNAHEPLNANECEAMLPRATDPTDVAVAVAYHRWADAPELEPLRAAASRLRRAVRTSVCEPLLTALGALLGLEEGALSARCAMRGSDNTSLLRLLEYPLQPPSADGAQSACSSTSAWGVSEHTDYELFSVLHQQASGLQVRDRRGRWVCLPHSPDVLTVIMGDMAERLSAGYFAATPHRVAPTRQGAGMARRSLVFFQALDEEERVAALSLSSARRVPGATPFLTFLESLPDEARRRYAQPVTQRSWSEEKDAAAESRRDAKRASS